MDNYYYQYILEKFYLDLEKQRIEEEIAMNLYKDEILISHDNIV